MRLLMYGAGCIGRGFIAPVFASGGYEIVVVDIDTELVQAINEQKSYAFSVIGERETECRVTGVRAVDGHDQGAVLREIADCDIMATSLGASALEKVASVIAEGFVMRKRPLDILICENLKNASEKLRGWIRCFLSEDADLSTLGLVEAAIGRMAMLREGHIRVEPYDFLPVDADAFVGPVPSIPQLIPASPFSFYEDRKLYIHNLGHAICAYCGMLSGYAYIWQAIESPSIRSIVKGAMLESAAALSEVYGISFGALYAHIEDLLLRFGNRLLGDECQRVSRDPLRKLAWDDRLIAPGRMALEHNVYPENIMIGMAAALCAATASRDEAARLLHETCRIAEPAPYLGLYDALGNGGVIEAVEKAQAMRIAQQRKII